MAGPTQQRVVTEFIPMGEAHRVFAPRDLARRVENFDRTPEGYLESVVGPAPWAPPRGQLALPTGEPYGLFACTLNHGTVQLILLRAGDTLYRFAGWKEGWDPIETGLRDNRNARFPDMFVSTGEYVIWTNGEDRPRAILYDGRVIPFGFANGPSAPSAFGPASPAPDDSATLHANSQGYSWWGEIGDVSSLADTKSGWLLPSQYAYRCQWEDDVGNRSPLSPFSNPVNIRSQFFTPIPDDPTWARGDCPGSNLDDVTRSFLVQCPSSPITHVARLILYRTSNRLTQGDAVRQVMVHAGRSGCVFSDGLPDAYLGALGVEIAPVPVFRVMVIHDGRLVIANFPGDPCGVRWSNVGQYGTFPEENYAQPTQSSGEVTALFTLSGVLHAATLSGIFAIPELGGRATPVALGSGVVAPRSVQTTSTGVMIYLDRTGFHAILPESPSPVRISAPVDALFQSGVSASRLRMAVSAIHPATGDYICAIPEAGRSRNTLLLAFDGARWRRYNYGISFADLAPLTDFRSYLLGCGRAGSETNVFAFNREVPDFIPPARAAIFRSGWLTLDDTASFPFTVRKLYLRLLDASDTTFEVRLFVNGNGTPVQTVTDIRSIGPDDARLPFSPIARNPRSDAVSRAVIGTARVHEPRAFWRWVPVTNVVDVTHFAFEVRAAWPHRLRIAAFSFDWSVQGEGDPRGRLLAHNA